MPSWYKALARTLTAVLALSFLAVGAHSTAYAASPPPVGPNLVSNGSFEQPAVDNGYVLFGDGDVPSWSLCQGPDLEIGNNWIGTAQDGNQYVELNSDAPSAACQTITTTPGVTYQLTFYYSARPGTGPDDNQLDVQWDGTDLTPSPLVLDGSNLMDTDWQKYTYDVTATAATTAIQFWDVGQASDNGCACGTLVDNVSVFQLDTAPSVTAPANQASSEGSVHSFSLGSFSDPDAGDSWTATVDWGDSSTQTTFNPSAPGTLGSQSHTYADNGTYTVTETVTDSHGASDSQSFTVTVSNVKPTVSNLTLGGATGTACTVGNSVTLNFGFSDPGVNDNPWLVDINWGDGSTHTTYNAASQGAQPQQSHVYAAGSYQITVKVTDKDVGSGTNSTAANAVSHLYTMSAILPPFNADGSSIWKFGSTIPVKVTITDCSGKSVGNLAPQIGTQLKNSADPAGGIDEVMSTSAADTGTTLRYDPTGQQYIYNLASKSLADGSATYYVYVRESHSIGKDPSGNPSAGQSYQQFALKLK